MLTAERLHPGASRYCGPSLGRISQTCDELVVCVKAGRPGTWVRLHDHDARPSESIARPTLPDVACLHGVEAAATALSFWYWSRD